MTEQPISIITSESDASLVKIERAAELIQSAKVLDEAFALRALFRETEIRARQRGLQDVEQKAIEYKFWVEDKIGEILEKMERTGERSRGVFSETENPRSTKKSTPSKTLKQLGISKNESSRYQQFHRLPEQAKKEAIEKAKRKVQRAKESAVHEILQREYRKNPKPIPIPKNVSLEIIRGNFTRNNLGSNSVDLIFTDPFYGQEYADVWAALAKEARRVLKPGAFLVAHSGQLTLPKAIESLSQHLNWVWQACLLFSGKQPQYWACGNKVSVTNGWKPYLIFCKGLPQRTVGFCDRLNGDLSQINDRARSTKENFEMAQGENEASYWVEKLTRQGDLVWEPLAGSGSTIAACLDLKRNCIAHEINPERFDSLQKRFLSNNPSPGKAILAGEEKVKEESQLLKRAITKEVVMCKCTHPLSDHSKFRSAKNCKMKGCKCKGFRSAGVKRA